MVQLGHRSAWIEVDENPLPEYGIKHSADGRKVECWIPSESGKQFIIKCLCPKDVRTSAARIWWIIDGVEVSCNMVHDSRSRPGVKYDLSSKKGVSTSTTTWAPFVFATHQLTDNEEFLVSRPGLGDITIEIVQTAIINRVRKPYIVDRRPRLATAIHERSKKGIVHGVQYGQELSRSGKPKVGYDTLDNGETLAIFIFKYRPLDILKADGIVPQNTSTRHAPPSAAGPSSDPACVNEERHVEKEILASRKRALLEELRLIEEEEGKQESLMEDVKPKIKNEPRLNNRLNNTIEIIDLT